MELHDAHQVQLQHVDSLRRVLAETSPPAAAAGSVVAYTAAYPARVNATWLKVAYLLLPLVWLHAVATADPPRARRAIEGKLRCWHDPVVCEAAAPVAQTLVLWPANVHVTTMAVQALHAAADAVAVAVPMVRVHVAEAKGAVAIVVPMARMPAVEADAVIQARIMDIGAYPAETEAAHIQAPPEVLAVAVGTAAELAVPSTAAHWVPLDGGLAAVPLAPASSFPRGERATSGRVLVAVAIAAPVAPVSLT